MNHSNIVLGIAWNFILFATVISSYKHKENSDERKNWRNLSFISIYIYIFCFFEKCLSTQISVLSWESGSYIEWNLSCNNFTEKNRYKLQLPKRDCVMDRQQTEKGLGSTPLFSFVTEAQCQLEQNYLLFYLLSS